jgi:FkbM family methyltransferase
MKIFGVEANPRMCDLILNEGFPGILLNNVVFNESGSMELKMYREDGLDASILSIRSRKVTATYVVECITLDEADNKFGNQDEILLWMDIEGAELAALISGISLLQSRRVKWINLEVRENPPWERGCKASEVDAFLMSQGFSKVAEYNKHPHVGHYDAIYALSS